VEIMGQERLARFHRGGADMARRTPNFRRGRIGSVSRVLSKVAKLPRASGSAPAAAFPCSIRRPGPQRSRWGGRAALFLMVSKGAGTKNRNQNLGPPGTRRRASRWPPTRVSSPPWQVAFLWGLRCPPVPKRSPGPPAGHGIPQGWLGAGRARGARRAQDRGDPRTRVDLVRFSAPAGPRPRAFPCVPETRRWLRAPGSLLRAGTRAATSLSPSPSRDTTVSWRSRIADCVGAQVSSSHSSRDERGQMAQKWRPQIPLEKS
jgi:hypothetical protein